jgi:hypothetical protein
MPLDLQGDDLDVVVACVAARLPRLKTWEASRVIPPPPVRRTTEGLRDYLGSRCSEELRRRGVIS